MHKNLTLPPGASAVIDKIYSFNIDGAIADAQRFQATQPDHPLGYLLEAEALWWKIFCTSAEFKYGMTDARHRPKLAADQHYQDLVAKASTIALAQLKDHETPEMQFYAGMADAFSARFFGLRGENRASARSGVHAREHFLRAIQMDPQLADADFGLGLYNYYVDTLGALARLLSFFMGIPGGNKQEGIRQLETILPRVFSLLPPLAFTWPWICIATINSMKKRSLSSARSSRNIPPIRSSNWPEAIYTLSWAVSNRPWIATVLLRRCPCRMLSAAPISSNS